MSFPEAIVKAIGDLKTQAADMASQVTAAQRNGKYPTNPTVAISQTQEFVRCAAIDKDNWSALVQPLIVGYDGNTFVLHQNPERKAYKCYIPGNAAQPLVGDCGLAVGFNEVTLNNSGTSTERVFAFTTLGAPAVPTVITSFLGVYDVRTSAEAQGVTFVASIGIHGPQVYQARLFPLGMDVELYSEEYVIQVDMSRRDAIPPGTFLIASRGPMTRGSILTMSGTFTVTATTAFASGFYVQAPIWM